jgi:hypothetical protein
MTNQNKIGNSFQNLLNYLHNNVTAINNSKLFAGLMIITLNISSKFVTMKLSKTMEAYLKYTFSRDILVFAIAWMGTREIYIAFIITIIFIIFMDFILNEDSMFCCLPKNFTDYHVSLLENNDRITEEDIKKAKEILEKAQLQKESDNEQNKNVSQMQFQTYGLY